jgi:glycosyltransferase involved in cell wall biosynthesis
MGNDLKIGILTVHSFNGEIGGAERLFDGLYRALTERGHDAELVDIPSDEASFEGIQETYLRCYDLDVSAFEGVISTKAPTYLVRHPNHVCYLVHTIRVYYDMFGETFPDASARMLAQRSLIHRLDSLALSWPRTRRVFAIGNEVARRLQQSNGIEATVLHPPLGFDNFQPGVCGDYLFLPGRLHRWKRVDLAIEAMRFVTAPIRLVVAGSGEEQDSLKALAKGDPRISFLGRVSDEELADLYSNALGVVFVPLREDYGYVTVEAFRSGKPVITCGDSGEAAMLVENEKTGLVVSPDPASLGEAFHRLARDRQFAIALGAAALVRETKIRWDSVVPALVDALELARGGVINGSHG